MLGPQPPQVEAPTFDAQRIAVRFIVNREPAERSHRTTRAVIAAPAVTLLAVVKYAVELAGAALIAVARRVSGQVRKLADLVQPQTLAMPPPRP